MLSLFAVACAPKGSKSHRIRPTIHDALETSLYFRNDANDLLIKNALNHAITRCEQSGLLLRQPSEVWVHKNVASFVNASKQSAHTLRAYSRYAIVHILPTQYWSESSPSDVENRLVHELVHLATFQNLGSEKQARTIAPPFWFLEGVASVLSNQARIRLPKADMLRRLKTQNGIDIIARVDSTLAYAIAHHTCAAWLENKDADFLKAFVEYARKDQKKGAIERALQHFSQVSSSELFERLKAPR